MSTLSGWLKWVCVWCVVFGSAGVADASMQVTAERSSWKVSCSTDGTREVQIEFWLLLGGKQGTVTIRGPLPEERAHSRWGISPMAGGRVSVSWCDSGSAWACIEAVGGEVSAQRDGGDWLDGDMAVTLVSGEELRATFKAEWSWQQGEVCV